MNVETNGVSSPTNLGDDDVFSWMFMNPELFPTRSFIPGILPQAEELSLSSPPLSPKRVKLETKEIFERRSSNDQDEEDDDDDDEDDDEESSNESISKQQQKKGTTSSKRKGKTSSSSSSALSQDNDPRTKRLEKNREIARNCRKRKREKMEALEEEVQKLRDWNRQLEIKLKQIPENGAKEEVRKREVEEIASLVSNEGSSEQEIRKKLHQYKEVYSDFGRDRKQAITFHLEQLKTLLLPNQVSKMTIWSLQQEDEFYDEQRNKTTFGGGIWNLLCEELKLTEEQKRTLLNMRDEIRGQRKNVGECLKILKELETRINENIGSMSKQMAKIMSVTTPSQQARFLLWIEKNQAAVQVLNNIWEQKKELRA